MNLALGFSLLGVSLAGAASRGNVDGGLERLLFATDASGVSVYEISDSHKVLRKIDFPETGDYNGISVRQQTGIAERAAPVRCGSPVNRSTAYAPSLADFAVSSRNRAEPRHVSRPWASRPRSTGSGCSASSVGGAGQGFC